MGPPQPAAQRQPGPTPLRTHAIRAARALGWLAVALVAAPLLLLVLGDSLAATRYLTGLPLHVCTALHVAVAIGLAWAAARAKARGAALPRPRLLPWALWASCTSLCAHWLHTLLWVPETHGLVTVGGGDAGHHMAIAQQVATSSPRIYVGQTGAHTTAWLLGQLFDLEIPDAMAWTWIGGGTALYALVLAMVTAATRDLRPAAQLVAIPLAAGLMVAGTTGYVPMWLHYYQAEGFFGHLYALVPIALMLVAATADAWWLRAVSLLAAAGLLRFTYALNAGEALVAVALLLWHAATTRGPAPDAPDTPSWHRWLAAPPWWARAGLVAVGLGACAGAWFAWNKLWALRKMTGGIMAHDLTTETVVLGVLTITTAILGLSAAVAGRALRLPSLARVARVATIAATLGLGPWLVHQHWDADLDLPRQYYYRKHATLALLTLATTVPALAALLYAHVAQRRQALGLALIAAAAITFTDTAVDKQAEASERIAWSYRERVDPKVRWRINTPMWEPHVMARIRQVLAQQGRAFGGYQHPSWPVHSVMNSAFPRWSTTEPMTVVDIKERRWKEWIQGLEARPGTCRFFTASRDQLIGFARHDRRMKGRTFPLVRGLLRRPDLRCERWRPPRPEQKTQRLCWVCEAP